MVLVMKMHISLVRGNSLTSKSNDIITKRSLNASGEVEKSEKIEVSLKPTVYHVDCLAIRKFDASSGDGVYTIYPGGADGSEGHQVYCDMEHGGWTVLQRRFDGSVRFDRTYSEYKTGFGNLFGEHWMGLELQHIMTTKYDMELRIELVDRDRQTKYANYKTFNIGSENEGYRIYFEEFSGTAGDSLSFHPWLYSYHQNRKFSTKDHDPYRHSCSTTAGGNGGWWFRNCFYCNLNGKYDDPGWARGIYWRTFSYKGLAASQMLIRRK